jgi:hypothetical protein
MKYYTDIVLESTKHSHTPEATAALGIIADLYDEATDNNAMVTQQGRTVFVAYPGTDPSDAPNILEDLFEWPLKKTSIAEYSYHAGFYLAYAETKPQLLALLKTLSFDNIVVAGHSMGAAAAGIAAIELTQLGFNVTDAVLFECPKFVCKHGIEFLFSKVKVQSFINGNDAIWFVAPGLKRGPFTRIGKPVWWKVFSIKDHFMWDSPHNQGVVTSLQKYFGPNF